MSNETSVCPVCGHEQETPLGVMGNLTHYRCRQCGGQWSELASGPAPVPVSYASEVIADSSGKWVGNALRFATEDEAKKYADNLFMRWTSVREFRVVKSQDPVNYRWDVEQQRAVSIEGGV